MNNHISIIISTRNAEPFIERCLNSAISQNYPNFEIIFIDACSSDSTFEIASRFKDKVRVFKNRKRKFQGGNILAGTRLSKPKSIIVTLDGDDWFPHENVLSRVNQEYVNTDCWMTYGTYEEFPTRSVSHIYREYPKDVRENKTFRSYRWLASHLRTFRRELFLKIKVSDLKENGEFFSAAPDLTFQFPMLEMCGVNKSRYIPDILYIYNMSNPVSESRIMAENIQRIESIIRSRHPYPTLESLYE